jgi:hypothetical protein
MDDDGETFSMVACFGYAEPRQLSGHQFVYFVNLVTFSGALDI